MENYNLEVLLERSNQVSLGIRARQTGITLKEYFLNQKQRAKNILKSQRVKVSNAVATIDVTIKVKRNASSTEYVKITNKAGKATRQLLCSQGMTINKVLSNFKKFATQIYGLIKDRCRTIEKICNAGIAKCGPIIKGKTDQATVNNAKAMKVEVKEYNALLNDSLEDMRELFKAYHRAFR